MISLAGNLKIKQLTLFVRHAYRKAITFLRVYPKKLETLEDLEEMKSLGPRIREKCKEYLTQGKIKKIEIIST